MIFNRILTQRFPLCFSDSVVTCCRDTTSQGMVASATRTATSGSLVRNSCTATRQSKAQHEWHVCLSVYSALQDSEPKDIHVFVYALSTTWRTLYACHSSICPAIHPSFCPTFVVSCQVYLSLIALKHLSRYKKTRCAVPQQLYFCKPVACVHLHALCCCTASQQV